MSNNTIQINLASWIPMASATAARRMTKTAWSKTCRIYHMRRSMTIRSGRPRSCTPEWNPTCPCQSPAAPLSKLSATLSIQMSSSPQILSKRSHNSTWPHTTLQTTSSTSKKSRASAKCYPTEHTSRSHLRITVAACAMQALILKRRRISRTELMKTGWKEVTYLIAFLVIRPCRNFLHRKRMFKSSWVRVWFVRGQVERLEVGNIIMEVTKTTK